MKNKTAVFTILLSLSLNIFGQNINGKIGLNGQFILRDTNNTFLTLPQNTGFLTLNRSIVLQNTTSSTIGVLYKDSERFIHNYKAPGTDGKNTFIGMNSGNFTMNGSSVEASQNTAVGQFTLYSLTSGSSNSAFGLNSLFGTTTGYNNSAYGNGSMFGNTTGHDNSAYGTASLPTNTTGSNNSVFGSFGLMLNTTGFSNSAFGSNCMEANTTGNSNSAFGEQSLSVNTTGNGNSAFGSGALNSLLTGNFNIGLGNNSGSSLTSGNNNVIIGYNAQVPSNTGTGQVRIGNTSITYAGIQVAWTITSDRRWKENIISSPLGLKFISKLNPVSYVRKNDESKKTEYGLIAQEVEQVLNEEGAENSAMITVTDEGNYELRYNDLLAPMIKAIQELKQEKDEEIAKLNERVQKLEQTINELKANQQVVNTSSE
jgi:hypothetical protein